MTVLIPYDNRQQRQALAYLYKELKRAKRTLAYVEYKSRSLEELRNLQNKIDSLEWLIAVAIKEG